MSANAEQATPNRCYCKAQDGENSLNKIAEIVTVVNLKVQKLRDEVSALKNVSLDKEKKLFQKTETACRHSSCCRSEFDISSNNVGYDKVTDSENSKVLASLIKNNSINDYMTEYTKIDDRTSNHVKDLNNICTNEKLQVTDCKPIIRKRRKKKISHGVQCDLRMECKRKRNFLNCFITESHTKVHNLKLNKKMKFSSKSNIHTIFNPDVERMKLKNMKEQKNGHIFQLDTYAHGEDNAVRGKSSQMSKLIKNEPKKETSREIKTKDERESFKHSMTSRMSGGAEIRGNYLISDFHNKIQKINLYKNVKFDAMNVKRRLDACINELNGIIEDVSLILPDMNVSKKLQK
ncbi:uncharacterized protein [Bombus flavifrons]|uniref:uncharacterized protein n=1 Tax=Bombus flavifrons TaxID=103934 RepID=UPI003703B070